MQKFLTFLLVAVVVVFGWVIFSDVGNKMNRNSDQQVASNQQALPDVTPLPDTSTQQPSPEPVVNEPVSTQAIVLDAPADGATVASPLIISGKAKATGKIYVSIQNSSGKELIAESGTLIGPADADGYSKFQVKILYEFTNTKEGFVEMYTKDDSGNKKDSVKVAVKFS